MFGSLNLGIETLGNWNFNLKLHVIDRASGHRVHWKTVKYGMGIYVNFCDEESWDRKICTADGKHATQK